jgi:hypothetical protein
MTPRSTSRHQQALACNSEGKSTEEIGLHCTARRRQSSGGQSRSSEAFSLPFEDCLLQFNDNKRNGFNSSIDFSQVLKFVSCLDMSHVSCSLVPNHSSSDILLVSQSISIHVPQVEEQRWIRIIIISSLAIPV